MNKEEIKSRYEALFNAGGELYAVLDEKGTFLEINPAGLALLEADSAKMIVGKTADEIFGKSKAKEVGAKARGVIESGKPTRFDWLVRKAGGPSRHFSARMVPIKDDKGKVNSAYLIAINLSELESIREDLASLTEATEQMMSRLSGMLGVARSEPRGN